MPASKKIKINAESISEEGNDQGNGRSAETESKERATQSQPKDAGSAEKSKTNQSVEDDRENQPDAVGELEMKFEAAQTEAKETYERLLRVSAEFENYKKRLTREMDDTRKYANQELFKELLAVVDNLELALKAAKDAGGTDNGLADGVELTLKEILKIFHKFSVKPIEALGKPFDPKYHEAMMREETDEQPENTVVSEMQRGYMIHDRLLRPAMVVVAMPKSNEEE